MKAIKLLLLSLGLLAGVAQGANEMAYTPNDAGGYIMFTYSNCVYTSTQQRVPNQFYVYSTNSNGIKGLDGCYYYKHPFYFVEWNSGSKLNVNVNTVTPIK